MNVLFPFRSGVQAAYDRSPTDSLVFRRQPSQRRQEQNAVHRVAATSQREQNVAGAKHSKSDIPQIPPPPTIASPTSLRSRSHSPSTARGSQKPGTWGLGWPQSRWWVGLELSNDVGLLGGHSRACGEGKAGGGDQRGKAAGPHPLPRRGSAVHRSQAESVSAVIVLSGWHTEYWIIAHLHPWATESSDRESEYTRWSGRIPRETDPTICSEFPFAYPNKGAHIIRKRLAQNYIPPRCTEGRAQVHGGAVILLVREMHDSRRGL